MLKVRTILYYRFIISNNKLTESASVWPSITKAGTWPMGFNFLYSSDCYRTKFLHKDYIYYHNYQSSLGFCYIVQIFFKPHMIRITKFK